MYLNRISACTVTKIRYFDVQIAKKCGYFDRESKIVHATRFKGYVLVRSVPYQDKFEN